MFIPLQANLQVKQLLAAIALLVLVACASRVPPTGGDVDKNPPEVIASNPPQNTTNFNGDKIVLEFNEYVELKDGGTGIIISPPMGTPPEVTLKGKSVTLKFKQKPDENTTYNVTFGKSVTDLTEGNQLVEYPFVFSTGEVLDSFQITGYLVDAYTNQAVKDGLVLLYTSTEDSLPYTTLPRYFARSNAAGIYTVRNIKPGTYRILALQDGNSDYKFTLPDEKIAFGNDLTELSQSNTPIPEFRMFTARPKTQKLLKKKFDPPGKVTLKYAIPPDNWEVKPYQSEIQGSILYNFKPGMDSMEVWIPGKPLDTLKLISTVSLGDSLRNDTLIFNAKRLSESRGGKGMQRKSAPDTSLRISVESFAGKLKSTDSILVKFSAPVLENGGSTMQFQFLKDTTEVPVGRWSANRMTYTLALPPKQSEFSLLIPKGNFQDLFGRKNDTTLVKISLFTEEELGNLDFSFKNDSLDGSFILEMIDKAGKVVETKNVNRSEKIKFKNMSPGSYSFRLIYDLNKDGRWTSGDLALRRQPEKMYYLAQPINMRAGWDMDIEWNPWKKSAGGMKQ